MGEIYDDLKKRVDHLQYDEINPLKSEVNDIKITLSNNDLLTRQVVDSNKTLSNTMESLKDTMVEISQSVKDSNRVTSQLAVTVEELNKKISSVEISTKDSIEAFSEKLDKIDEKSKVDILDWCKSKWFEIVLAIGALSYALSQFIK